MNELVLQLVSGSIIGLILATTGVGGGIIVIPVLGFVFHMDALAAVATANLLSLLMKLSSSVMHYRLGNISLHNVLITTLIMLPVTMLSSYFISYAGTLPKWSATVEFGVNLTIVLAIVFSFIPMLRRRKTTHDEELTGKALDEQSYSAFILPGIFTSLIIGTTGVGGGILVLPVFIHYLNMGVKEAIGTSILVTALLSGASALAYSQGGHTDISMAWWLFVGSLFSLPLANRLLKTLSQQVFRKLTYFFIIVSAIAMTAKLFL